VKTKKKRSCNVDTITNIINNILEKSKMRRNPETFKKIFRFAKKNCNKQNCSSKRRNILKEKNVMLQEQNKLFKKSKISLLETILSELKQVNNLT